MKIARQLLRDAGWLFVSIVVLGGATDASADVLVSSFNNDRILRFANDGTPLGDFVPPGSGGLNGPEGLAIGPDGNLYVSSLVNEKILRYNGTTGAFIDALPSSPSLPQGLVFGPDGNLYVTDGKYGAVVRFNGSTGAFMDEFVPSHSGGLFEADGIHFGPDGNLYVAGSVSGAVHRYDGTAGAPLGAIATGPLAGFTFGPGNDLFVPQGAVVRRFDGVTGALEGVFASGGGGVAFNDAAFAPDGYLYVADYQGNKLLRFDGTTGAFVDVFVSGGNLDGPTYLLILDFNQPPVADAGPDQTVPCDGPEGTLVTLDGLGSYDPDDDDLAYEWSVAEGSGVVIDDPSLPITAATFPRGVHEVTLTVYDLDETGARKGEGVVASVMIEVVDDDPPLALVTTDLAALQPSNNKMIPVTVIVQASDACTDPNDLSLYCTVSSSQPDDTDGTGELTGDVDGQDGYTAPVEVILEPVGDGAYRGIVNLRAERDGAIKAGRTYSIKLDVIDGSGKMSSASTAVVVPHNGKKL